MQQMKHTIRSFAKQGDLIHDKPIRQDRRKQHAQCLLNLCDLRGLESTGQRDMKPEFIANIGIAPAGQKRFLISGQCAGATAGELCLTQRRAKGIKFTHDIKSQAPKCCLVAIGTERKKPAKCCDVQPRKA